MFVFMLLIVLAAEEATTAVLPPNSSDAPVFDSLVISNQFNGYTPTSQDSPHSDLTARRDGLQRDSLYKRTFSGRNNQGRAGWRSSKPGHIQNEQRSDDETHSTFAVSGDDEGLIVNVDNPFRTSSERRRPPQHRSSNSMVRAQLKTERSNQDSRNDCKEISQDSLHLNGDVGDRRTAKDEEIKSDTSGREYLAAECTGCKEKRCDILATTPATHHRSSPAAVATTAFINSIKSEAQLTTQMSRGRSHETDAAISDIKVYGYFGDEEERRTANAGGQQAAKPDPNDGKIYFEPKRQKMTTPSDRDRPSEHTGVSSSATAVEAVTLANRIAFDVNMQCGPEEVKLGGRCVPTS